jgi:hypothetical protein
MKKIIVLLSILVLSFPALSQRNINEAATIPMFSVSYSYQFPLQDMADRFGSNSNVGAAFTLKGKKGWLLGVDASYLFGNDIKEENLMHGILTSNGQIINQHGEYANFVTSERGYFIGFKLGKIIPLHTTSPNSGLYISGTIGFLEHHIRIDNEGNNAPQILDDYKKGYDRLTNGLAAKGFIGYMHIGKSQFANFFGGIEYIHSWTQCRRDYNFDTRETDTRKRNDNLFGIRVGWIVPIYRRVPDSYFTF